MDLFGINVLFCLLSMKKDNHFSHSIISFDQQMVDDSVLWQE